MEIQEIIKDLTSEIDRKLKEFVESGLYFYGYSLDDKQKLDFMLYETVDGSRKYVVKDENRDILFQVCVDYEYIDDCKTNTSIYLVLVKENDYGKKKEN